MATPKNAPAEQPQAKAAYVAKIPLKDAPQHVAEGETPREYAAGDDVSHWDADRLQSALTRGIVVQAKG